MRVAVVGSGVAGLSAARALASQHEVTVFEAAARLGGHANTEVVRLDGREVAVDTGFLVFNPNTYPGFCRLIDELDVPVVESDMSFSVRCEASGLEYNGTNWNGIFAQRRNLFRPAFLRMLGDIVRFYREAPRAIEGSGADLTLGEFLDAGGYSDLFVDKHLVPMASAVWSSGNSDTRAIPLAFLVRFFANHGFLETGHRPVWRTIRGGSREYVKRMVQPFGDRIRLAAPVVAVERDADGVRLTVRGEEPERFDRVVLAVHGDTALGMLADASPLEREVLGSFRFQDNDVVLHTDTSLLPKRRRAWASWNYHVDAATSELPRVTYWINLLQDLPTEVPVLVSLNCTDRIAPDRVLGRYAYSHPIFDEAAVAAQARFEEIDGAGGVHFAGAYWRNGFHEDGLFSGQRAASRITEAVLV